MTAAISQPNNSLQINKLIILNLFIISLLWFLLLPGSAGARGQSALESDFSRAIAQSSLLTSQQKAEWRKMGLSEVKRLMALGVNEDLIRDLVQNALDADWRASFFVDLGHSLSRRVHEGEDQILVAQDLVIQALLNEKPDQELAGLTGSPLEPGFNRTIKVYDSEDPSDDIAKEASLIETLRQSPEPGQTVPSAPAGKDEKMTAVSAAGLKDAMRSWLGSPYRWAGDSKDGVDCSGFVKAVYAEQGVTLPRGSYFMSQAGTPVPPGDYRLGDLLIFKRDGRTVHVGIYLGSGYFIHSAKGAGVAVSSLAGSKYEDMLHDARRVALVQMPDRQYAETAHLLEK